jgi:tetratricopeptide (TPR) repeat protein
MRGERLVAAGNCTEAIPILACAAEAEPAEARTQFLLGRCHLSARDYEAADEHLRAARRLDPQLPDIDLAVGIARFHLEDFAGATEAFNAAEGRTQDTAALELYRGLALLQEGVEHREAAAALSRARQANPDAVEPIASYYEGIALANASEADAAEDALERARKASPDSLWAEAAERALRRIGGWQAGDAWASVTFGVEYDTNVVLRGRDVTLPREISGSSDMRLVWGASLGKELWRNRDWSFGAMLNYSGSAHDDLNEFNSHYPVASFWIDRRLSEQLTAQLQGDFGYAWLDANPYLNTQALTPALYYQWAGGQVSRLSARFYRNDFLFSDGIDIPDGPGVVGGVCPGGFVFCGPLGLNEPSSRDRDGVGVSVEFEHWWPVEAISTRFRSSYLYHLFDAQGNEYSFQGHELRLGARTQLPWEIVLDTYGSILYRPFDRRSSHLSVGLERDLNEQLSAALRYQWIDNDSNTAVFDYDREIIGLYFTLLLL